MNTFFTVYIQTVIFSIIIFVVFQKYISTEIMNQGKIFDVMERNNESNLNENMKDDKKPIRINATNILFFIPLLNIIFSLTFVGIMTLIELEKRSRITFDVLDYLIKQGIFKGDVDIK